MDLDQQDGPVHQLANQLRKHYSTYDLPRHVPRRIAYALGGRQAVFVDVRLWEELMNTNGCIVTYTDELIAVTEVRGLSDNADSEGTATVSVVPRHTLEKVELLQDGQPERNTHEHWRIDRNLGSDGWPRGGALTLTYADLDKPVVLPSMNRTDRDFEDFLPSLLSDLGRCGTK